MQIYAQGECAARWISHDDARLNIVTRVWWWMNCNWYMQKINIHWQNANERLSRLVKHLLICSETWIYDWAEPFPVLILYDKWECYRVFTIFFNLSEIDYLYTTYAQVALSWIKHCYSTISIPSIFLANNWPEESKQKTTG